MPEKKPSIELPLSSSTEEVCSQCGETGCQHSNTTFDVASAADRRRRAKEAQPLPPELEEFAATYEIEGMIGEGGMSSVYKARHRALDKPTAIKMLHSHLVRDVVQLKRFEQEAHALDLLEHPNIVKLRDFGVTTTTQKPYLIMDFLEGSSLSEVLKSGPMPVNRAMKIFIQICDALDHAHGKSIIHRDIKPSNIVLVPEKDGGDSVRIVDFGIAKFNQDEINPGLTQTGDVFGSPLYMSPEQCLGQKLDQRTDIYALGCVMYEVLSGKPPLSGESALATIHKHTSEMPKPLTVPNCDVGLRDRLDQIIFKTLEKDPDRRYQSARDLKRDLEELLACTGFRKGAGFYVRYARFYRHTANVIKAHPIMVLAAVAIAVAAASFGTYKFASHSASVLQDPVPINSSVDWIWTDLPTEPMLGDYKHNLRRVLQIIVEYRNRLGNNAPEVMHQERKVSSYLMRWGKWGEAIAHLEKARDGVMINYGMKDVNLPDINNSIGDCYLQQKDYKKAAMAYKDAMDEYQEFVSTADNCPTITGLKYGICLLKMNNSASIDEAKLQFASVRDYCMTHKRPEQFEHGAAMAGSGDCSLCLVERGLPTPELRKEELERALSFITSAGDGLENASQHDINLLTLRLGDVRILQGDLKEAKVCYERSLQKPECFTTAELAVIRRNYARLLWRNFDWMRALAMDDQANLDAKDASGRINEQTTLHFDPDERDTF